MCPVCAETYVDEEDMVNCCIADEFENFTCPICKTDYRHFAEAKEKQKAFQNVSMAQMARELAVQGFKEINAQRNTNEKLTNEIAALEDERDELKAERDELLNEIPEGCTPADARVLREENHKLVAQLEEARKQEPDSWRITSRQFCGTHTTDKEIADHWMKTGEAYPLYASPVPAQQAAVPDGWMLVPVKPTEDMLESYEYVGGSCHSCTQRLASPERARTSDPRLRRP